MVLIEEIDLEEDTGECVLEDDDGCVLEDDSGCVLEEEGIIAMPSKSDSLPVLEGNEAGDAGEMNDDSDDELWEIPFSADAEEVPVDETVEVRLFRRGDERLGLVLDAGNIIVALREGTPASASGELFVGDQILAVQGVACSEKRRVAQLLRELPDAPVYAFTVRRALDLDHAATHSDVVDHGPLMTPEEKLEHEQRELEHRQMLRERIDAMDAPDEVLDKGF